jgi:hypothetical protein
MFTAIQAVCAGQRGSRTAIETNNNISIEAIFHWGYKEIYLIIENKRLVRLAPFK